MNKKQRFEDNWKKKYGLAYNTFRQWLKRNHELSVKGLNEEQIHMFVDDHEWSTKTFEEVYGVKYYAFRDWFERHYENKIGDIDKGNMFQYVMEYTKASLLYSTNKQDLYTLITKLAREIRLEESHEYTETENTIISNVLEGEYE